MLRLQLLALFQNYLNGPQQVLIEGKVLALLAKGYNVRGFENFYETR